MSVTGTINYKIFIFIVINENIPFKSGIIHTVRRQLYCLSSYFSYWFVSTVSLPGRWLSQRVPTSSIPAAGERLPNNIPFSY